MSARIRDYIRRNVLGLVAIFIALNAGAYAAAIAPPNSVVSSSIKDGEVKTPDLGPSAATTPKIATGAVTSPKLKAGAVTNPKIAANAVGSGNVVDNSLTGSDVDESTLGAVPSATNATNATNADQLDNLDSTAFLGAAVTAVSDDDFRPNDNNNLLADKNTNQVGHTEYANAHANGAFPVSVTWLAEVETDGFACLFAGHALF